LSHQFFGDFVAEICIQCTLLPARGFHRHSAQLAWQKGTDEVLKNGRKNEISVSVKRQNNMQDHAGI
jgi:hypothetical protein